jgi:hypothetical protein
VKTTTVVTIGLDRVVLGLTGLLLLACTSVNYAQVYDAESDFSITNGNPNGVWTYGWSADLTSMLNIYTQSVTSGVLEGWVHSTSIAPHVGRNPSDSPVNIIPPRTTYFHPGPAGEFSHFLFTAPASSAYFVAATFTPVDVGGTDVHILTNGTSLFDGDVSPGNSQSYSTSIPLTLLAPQQA